MNGLYISHDKTILVRTRHKEIIKQQVKSLKVVLEGQLLVNNNVRGMNCYAKSLINSLILRQKNEYAITIFDYNHERGNRGKLIASLHSPNVEIYECNTLSYRDLMYEEHPFLPGMTYQDYTGACGNLFHFMTQQMLPEDLNINTVITVHDLIPFIFPDLCGERNVYLLKKTWSRIQTQRPFIITDSESTKNDVLNADSSLDGRVFTVPLAYQENELYPDNNQLLLEKCGINRPYVLFLGSNEKRKGADTVIDAFDIVKEKFLDIDLVFAGEMPEENIHYNKPRIKRLGAVDDTVRRALYSGAEIFVFPSLYEGFGLPVLEAMACGAPVITSNTSSLPEVAGDAAILIDPIDVEQLAFEIERLLTTESLRSSLIAKGFERCKRFSWEKTAEMTEDVYNVAYENSN